MKTLSKRSKRATTLTELLVVLAIISLLATIAVPVYLTQVQRARIAIAQSEVRAIAEAQQQCAIAHGFLVPIHILNNVPNPRAGEPTGSSTNRDDFDNLQSPGGHFLIDTYSKLDDQITGQLTLNSGDDRVERMISGWQGPFLNPKRLRYQNDDPNVPGSGELTIDLVVDPWGRPYRMYSDYGSLFTNSVPQSTNVINNPELGDDDMRLNTDEVDRFDRYAVVSYGPDGTTGFTTDPQDQGDDIYYQFVINTANETLYSNF